MKPTRKQTRSLGDRRFHLHETFVSKTVAKQHADGWRKRGELARVVRIASKNTQRHCAWQLWVTI